MKTKILSLALALMMIVSVAAALPVSAVTQAELTADNHIKLDAAAMQKTDATAACYTTAASVYASWGSVAADWVLNGSNTKATVAPMNTNNYLLYNFTVTEEQAGTYALYISGGKSTNVAVKLDNTTAVAISESPTTSISKMGEIFVRNYNLDAGTHSLKITATKTSYVSTALLVKGERPIERPVISNSESLKIEAEDIRYYDYDAVVSATTGESASNGVYLLAGSATTNPSFQIPVTVAETGLYNFRYIVGSHKSAAVSRVQIYLKDSDGNSIEIGDNVYTATSEYAIEEDVSANYSSTWKTYMPVYKYLNSKISIEAGNYTLEVVVGLTSDSKYKYQIDCFEFASVPSYTITATAEDGGSVSGGGAVEAGGSVTLTATPDAGYVFDGWYLNGGKESSDATYTFTVTGDATYIAKFKATVIVSFLDCTAYSCGSNDTVFAGMAVPDGCTYDWVTSNSRRCHYNQTSLFQKNINMPQAGWYDVLVASTSLNDSAAFVFGGGQCLSETLAATGDKTVVGVTNFGRIYLGKGTQGIYFQIAAGVGNAEQGSWAVRSTEIFDMRLQYSEEQSAEPDEILISANAPSRFVMANKTSLGEKNRHTWALDNSVNTVKWATTGSTKIGSNADWYEYDVVAPEAGYYDLYAASATLGNSLMSVIVNDMVCVEAAVQENINATDLNKCVETYFGKVYLKDGLNTIRVEGDVNSGAYYFFNLKLTPTEAPIANNEIRIVDHSNNAVDTSANVAVGTTVCAEVKATSNNVKIFVANYKDLGDDLMEMTGFTEIASTVEDGGVKIFRTALLPLKEGIVKAFIWDGTTFAPIDFDTATVVNPE